MTVKTKTASGYGLRVSDHRVDESGDSDERLPTARRMRADAVKNRARILAAAEEIFATEGVSVPIDRVAEKAGLGVGTLYRHFPTKEALFEAIVVARLETLLETVKAQREATDAGEALFSFLRAIAGQASAKRDLFEALGSAGIDIQRACRIRSRLSAHGRDRVRRTAVAHRNSAPRAHVVMLRRQEAVTYGRPLRPTAWANYGAMLDLAREKTSGFGLRQLTLRLTAL